MPVQEELSVAWISFGVEEWKKLPPTPGVYRFYDDSGQLLYVGKAKALSKRVGSYFQKTTALDRKTRRMIGQIAYIMYTEVPSEHDALLLESNLIKTHQPKYNILLRDDKNYPYVCVSSEPFPRLLKVRRSEKGKGLYLGPYTHGRSLRYLLHTVQDMCKLRTCNYDLSEKNIKKRKYKVCLEYHIGNCKGPCEGLQSKEHYDKEITTAVAILKGRLGNLRKHLRQALSEAMAQLRFEEAQQLKEKLAALEQLHSRSVVSNPALGDLDACTLVGTGSNMQANYMQIIEGRVIMSHTISLKLPIKEEPAEVLRLVLMQLREKYLSNSREILVNIPVASWQPGLRIHCPQQGDKKKLVALSLQNAWAKAHSPKSHPQKRSAKILRQIQRELRLQKPPEYIECFDISNLQAQNIVGAMVCFRNGRPDKAAYRYYRIRSVQEGPNDYAAMREVIQRRYQRLLKEQQPMPDLIVVDGGKGQLNAATQILQNLHIQVPVVGIAKRLEEVFLPGARQPLALSPNGDTMLLLQRIRDETHRSVLGFHRQQRSKKALDSSLTKIPGIGEATRTKLFQKFGSLKEIKSSTHETLIACIGKERARILKIALEK